MTGTNLSKRLKRLEACVSFPFGAIKSFSSLMSPQSDEEIAAWFRVTTRTIERRRKKRAFAEVMDRGKAKGRISVRRMQMKLLEQGNATMGVWLGKNILGQVDEIHHELNGSVMNYLSVVLPRSSALAGSGAQRLIDRGEPENVEIEPADYELCRKVDES